MSTAVHERLRELHSRTGDGLHVRLLWDERNGHVLVAVVDFKAAETFWVQVRDGDRGLDAFEHPFAYAYAACAVESRPPRIARFHGTRP